MTIRVLIADDQALVRAGFAAILEKQPDIDVVGEADDGRSAISLTERLRPDVVIMEVGMPNIDGIEATRRILALPSPPQVLILTTFDLNEHLYAAMKAGASGFLLKNVPGGELSNAIRSVARGETLLAPVITRRLIEDFVGRPLSGADRPKRLAELTDRELNVLTRIAHGRSNAEIAADLFLSEATVKTHVTRVLQKIGVRDRVQAVIVVYETGLIQPGRSPSGFLSAGR